jgi:hypothetical protein
MIVNKHREKKEGTTDEHRFVIITLLIYFGWSPRPSKVIQKQHLNKLHTSYAKKTPKTNNLKTIPSNPTHCHPKKFI